MSKDELAILLDARDKLCGFCENNECDKCQVTILMNNAYCECEDCEE